MTQQIVAIIQAYKTDFETVMAGKSEEVKAEIGQCFLEAQNWLLNSLPALLTKATNGSSDDMSTDFANVCREATLKLFVLESCSDRSAGTGLGRSRWLPAILESKWGDEARKALIVWQGIYGMNHFPPLLFSSKMRPERDALLELLNAKPIDISGLQIPQFDN